MHLTPQINEDILTLFGARVSLHVPYTFTRLFYFKDKQDFAARAGIVHADTLEAQFALIRFRGYRDEPTDIGCDNPPATVIYRLSAFFEYKAVRSDIDQTQSRQDLNAAIINIRNEILSIDTIVEGKARLLAFRPLTDIIENEESKYLGGVKGDLMEWNIEVEVK